MDREPQQEPRATVRVTTNDHPLPADCRVLRIPACGEQYLDGLLRVVGLDGRQLGERRDGGVGVGGEVDVVAGHGPIIVTLSTKCNFSRLGAAAAEHQ